MRQDNERKDGEDFTNGLAGIGPEHIRLILGMAKYIREKPEKLEWHAHKTYTREETIAYWKISPSTLWRWQQNGLEVLHCGNKEYRYYGQDVIDYTRSKVAPKSHQAKGATKKAKKQAKK